MVNKLIVLLIFHCLTACNLCDIIRESPKIIIIGAGSAGIAAASRLLDNGFTNVTIIEAENRIGGRLHSVKFGGYMIDLGGQWVHGENGSATFELAWPLGLLEKSNDAFNFTAKFFLSNGTSITDELSQEMMNFFANITPVALADNPEIKSIGDYAELEFNKYFAAHPQINSELYKPILEYMSLLNMGSIAANSWYDVSIVSDVRYVEAQGDQVINWKERSYSTILDILMKKYPNPEEELPVLNNTIFSNKVTKITYNQSGPVKIKTFDGSEYTADHVIFTASLGVLKANHEELFDPILSQKKINSIVNIGFGHVGKMFMYYENPWWPTGKNDYFWRSLVWTKEDKKELLNDPDRKWMLAVAYFFRVEHKPKVLGIWLSSNLSQEMERIPEEELSNQTMELMMRFFGNTYNITRPTQMIRSFWNSNENFRGTYSYRGLQSEVAKASYEHLAEPIVQNEKPILQFAGEATSETWATIHGAIRSGWREADRLINFYSTKE